MPDGSTVKYEQLGDNVTVITLNRPESLNAINRALRAEERRRSSGSTRTRRPGGDRHRRRSSFCAGRDLKERAADNAAGVQARPEDAMSQHSVHS